jgi:hypothetical protein
MNKEKEIKKDKYKENKLRYIPQADIEMLREDIYEQTGKINNNKNKIWKK